MATPYFTNDLKSQVQALQNPTIINPNTTPAQTAQTQALRVGKTTYQLSPSQYAYAQGMIGKGYTVVPDGGGGALPSFQMGTMTQSMPGALAGGNVQGSEAMIAQARALGLNEQDFTEQMIRKGQPGQRLAMGAAMTDYDTEKRSAEEQAKNYATGTGMLAGGVEAMENNLNTIAQQLSASMGQVGGLWERALSKADEFVEASRGRTQEVMRMVDSLTADMLDKHEFGKSHDMQVAVQSALGQMNETESVIARRYGADSPEMQQFQQTKMGTLTGIQSNLHAAYSQLGSQLRTSVAQLMGTSATQMAMYENYHEKAAMEVYTAAAQADQVYSLQASQYLVGIEQMKMNNQTMLAEWVANTPVFTVKMGSLIAALT